MVDRFWHCENELSSVVAFNIHSYFASYTLLHNASSKPCTLHIHANHHINSKCEYIIMLIFIMSATCINNSATTKCDSIAIQVRHIARENTQSIKPIASVHQSSTNSQPPAPAHTQKSKNPVPSGSALEIVCV